MDRSALRTLLIAVLCLSVLALAAATLDDTRTGGSGFGSGGGDGGGGEGPGDGGNRPTPSPQTPEPRPTTAPEQSEEPPELCAPIVKEPPVIIGVVLAAVLTFLALLRWYNEFVAIAGTLMVFGPITLIMLVLARCDREEPDPDTDPVNFSDGNTSGGGGGVGGDATGITEPTLPILVLVVLGILIVLGALAYYLTGDDTTGGGDDEEAPDEAEEDEPEVDAADVAEVGRVAGEAADRLEASGDFENEVYRAWREMTRPLNVPKPRSSTPREFADAAVAAGMNGDDVGRLTELFDEVRYGGREATPEREREAVSLLRSIEDEYADVSSAADLADAPDDAADDENPDDAGVDDG